MSKIEIGKFTNALLKGKTEEDIKNAYAKHFDIQYDTSERIDLYTPQVLFEFKYDKNLENLKVRATILAQILYYVRRLKYGHTDKQIPPILCLANHDGAILTETIQWIEYYTDIDVKYDWDLTPSIPDPKLVNDLSNNQILKDIHVYKIQELAGYSEFSDLLQKYLSSQYESNRIDKKIITESNFEDVFNYWNSIFGDQVRNGLKTSRYFVCDIQQGRTFFQKSDSKVVFMFSGEEARVKKILSRDYEHFWNLYQKVESADIIRSIIAKIDRLTDETLRRFYGEFFTPVRFAKKALDYIEKTIGKEWWKTGEYRLWDMAAGTGNLQYHLPVDALKYSYLSTIYKEDVEHCMRLFPDANCFQYDYLNDDIENLFPNGNINFAYQWKLPEKLRNDLQNTKIKWIILINPPFATSQKAGTSGGSKQSVSDTKLRKVMHKNDLGEVSRELFSQFLYRIKREFENKITYLGLFAPTKYINSNNDQKFRDTIFQFTFEKGFLFSSVNFSGTSRSNQFPIGFIIWNINKTKKLAEQKIELDLFDENIEKLGQKTIKSVHKEKFLSKWIKRQAATIKFPPVGSAINVKSNNKDTRDRVTKGFLVSLMCGGNDVQHQGKTCLLSMPYVSAGALSVTKENFEKAMVIHAVRRIPKDTWLIHSDQFMQPTGILTDEFTTDCAIWNLFSNSNQTVAMRNVVYEKETYQIHNQFFPFLLAEIKKWKISDSEISISTAKDEDRFLSKWLTDKKLSAESEQLLNKGKEIYQFYFENLNQLRTTKFKIETWDAGWWQIRNALSDVNMANELFDELKILHNILKEKLLPQIYEFGFI